MTGKDAEGQTRTRTRTQANGSTGTPEFIRLLNESNRELHFASYYCHDSTIIHYIPSVVETITHLKLLKAFEVLKKNICYGLTDEKSIESVWKAFVTNAVRRFITFISALKYSFPDSTVGISANENSRYIETIPKDYQFTSKMRQLLPPLDILMVWHAFLLNPSACYDNFARNNFLKFIFHPFPLDLINESVTNEDFQFKPPQIYINNFQGVMSKYGCQMAYEFNEPFIPENINIPIQCPICYQTLAQTKLSDTSTNRGFADADFKVNVIKDCRCGFGSEVDHENLRKRQLYSDLSQPDTKPMPNLYKHFSRVLHPYRIDFSVAKEDLIYKSLAFFFWKPYSLNLIINDFTSRRNRASKRILTIFREYFQMNLVHLTIPKDDVIEISEDLVGCVIRQERFVIKMNELNWLLSPLVVITMNEALKRYKRFWKMFEMSRSMLVPTLDIDLLWHTHQLSFHYYYNYSKSVRNELVEHDDKIDETRLNRAYEKTAKLYRSKFNEDYSICFCWYCMVVKGKSQSVFKKVFRSSSSKDEKSGMYDLVYNDSLGLSHISVHNAISIPSARSNKELQRLNKKYNVNNKNRQLPWNDPYLGGSYLMYPTLFVIPPLAPIPLSECNYYGSGSGGSGSCAGACTSAVCGGAVACGSSGGCGGGSGGGGGGCGGGGGGGGN